MAVGLWLLGLFVCAKYQSLYPWPLSSLFRFKVGWALIFVFTLSSYHYLALTHEAKSHKFASASADKFPLIFWLVLKDEQGSRIIMVWFCWKGLLFYYLALRRILFLLVVTWVFSFELYMLFYLLSEYTGSLLFLVRYLRFLENTNVLLQST